LKDEILGLLKEIEKTTLKYNSPYKMFMPKAQWVFNSNQGKSIVQIIAYLTLIAIIAPNKPNKAVTQKPVIILVLSIINPTITGPKNIPMA